MKLSNNTILITGGTSGIGLVLAHALQKLENKVIVLGRDSGRLQEAKRAGFDIMPCDMSDPGAIEQASVDLQNRYPDLNVLFNNAGIQYNYNFTENVVSPQKIVREININVTGQLILTQLLLPMIRSNNNGVIVNTTSGLGAFPKSDGLVYSASKAAMRNFTIGLRHKLKSTSVKVFEFIPPVTDTHMTSQRNEQKMSPDALVNHIIPQLQKNKPMLTVFSMRVFLIIARFFPGFAAKIVFE